MTSVRVTTRCNTTPAGQDYVQQPNTCRPVIAGRAMEMTLELYQSPAKMGDDVSAVRLRQVGYAIPTGFFGQNPPNKNPDWQPEHFASCLAH